MFEGQILIKTANTTSYFDCFRSLLRSIENGFTPDIVGGHKLRVNIVH